MPQNRWGIWKLWNALRFIARGTANGSQKWQRGAVSGPERLMAALKLLLVQSDGILIINRVCFGGHDRCQGVEAFERGRTEMLVNRSGRWWCIWMGTDMVPKLVCLALNQKWSRMKILIGGIVSVRYLGWRKVFYDGYWRCQPVCLRYQLVYLKYQLVYLSYQLVYLRYQLVHLRYRMVHLRCPLVY